MKTGYVYGLFALLIVIGIAGYFSMQRDPGIESVTGKAIKDQADNAANNVEQEVAQLAVPEETGRVCDGFGFVRTKVNADGSQEEYCYDPCEGDSKCAANWNDVEEEFVAVSSASSGGLVNTPPADLGTTNTQQITSGGGSERNKK